MLALSVLFWATALALRPWGDFPLGDDWAYSAAVERLARGEGLRLSHWGSPTVVLQAWWGRLFTLPFGFSHGALRLSTLVLAWAGLLAFHKTLRRLGAGETAALAGGVALLFNPLFFVLSHTFMTDVQALAWMLLAGWALVAGLQDDDRRLLVLASALSGAAYLVRQTGLCLPLGAALTLLARGERRSAVHLRLLGPCALAVAVHALWSRGAGTTAAFQAYALHATAAHLADPRLFAADLLRRLAGAALYLGMFLAPWLPCRPSNMDRPRAGNIAAASLILLALACVLLRLPPSTGDVVGRYGLGTCTLASSCAFKAAGWLGAPLFWAAATALGALSAALLARRLGSTTAPGGAAAPYASGFVLAFLASLAGRDCFDRYYLVLFPPAVLWLAARSAVRWRRIAPGLALLAAWSVCGAWDYLAWNGAKAEGALRLAATGLPREAVSAGMDWDAAHAFEARMAELLRKRRPEEIGLYDWWDPSRYAAAVSFASAARGGALERVGEVPYWTPLTFRTERVYLWRRRK